MGGIFWLASYPKSGNTWLRTFLHNLQRDGDEPADINEISTGSIAAARGWLDEVLGFDTAELTPDEVERLRPRVYDWAARDDETGYHKIHDAYTLTEDGGPLVGRAATMGAVYIVRDPRDVAPSAANHWHCTVDQAIANMENGAYALAGTRRALPSQVRQRLLDWSGHVLSWVDAPSLRCHVVRYEDMLADPLRVFVAVAAFLGLPDDEGRVAKAVRFSSFEELSRQETDRGFRERPPHTERFFRSGRGGGWRETLTQDQAARVVAAHGEVMRRFGYLDDTGAPA